MPPPRWRHAPPSRRASQPPAALMLLRRSTAGHGVPAGLPADVLGLADERPCFRRLQPALGPGALHWGWPSAVKRAPALQIRQSKKDLHTAHCRARQSSRQLQRRRRTGHKTGSCDCKPPWRPHAGSPGSAALLHPGLAGLLSRLVEHQLHQCAHLCCILQHSGAGSVGQRVPTSAPARHRGPCCCMRLPSRSTEAQLRPGVLKHPRVPQAALGGVGPAH